MYAKSRDRGRPPLSPPLPPRPEQSLYRRPVPPNYRGNAIVDGEERPSLGAEPPEPRFDHLPHIGAPAPSAPPPPVGERAPTPPDPPSAPPPAVPPGGGLLDLAHFPFGHGLGMEEWLLLGLMVFLLHEHRDGRERGDLDETVLLLGLLLLGG